MLEFITEGFKSMAANSEGVKRSLENRPETAGRLESSHYSDAPVEQAAANDLMLAEQMPEDQLADSMEAMADDIGLRARTQEFTDPDYIDGIRAQNERMDAVLSRQEGILSGNPSDLDYERAVETLDRYKGTVFEHELKDALVEKFESADAEQQLVQTDLGGTKPDVVMRGALEDMRIGDLTVHKGEDLYIEAKCGSADYIRSEMNHIAHQVEGHGDNSLVVVSRDYLELSPDVRAQFEQKLAEKGSHLYVADVSANELSVGLFSSLRL